MLTTAKALYVIGSMVTALATSLIVSDLLAWYIGRLTTGTVILDAGILAWCLLWHWWAYRNL